MSTERLMRASDHDRDKVTEALRDAYAVGRLDRDEFDERIAAACSARTCGELHDLTTDLPAPPAEGLPSDIVAERSAARRITHRRCVQKIWVCVLILAAGLAGKLFPSVVWAVAAMVLVVLVLPVRFR